MEIDLWNLIINWLVWILSWVVAYFVAKQNTKNEFEKLKYDYNMTIINERLKYYPELLSLTQDIWKNDKIAIEDQVNYYNEIAQKMNDWKWKWSWFLVLSKESYDIFSDLKNQLSKSPLNSKNWYSQEIQDKIWKLRWDLRASLKNDIWIKWF